MTPERVATEARVHELESTPLPPLEATTLEKALRFLADGLGALGVLLVAHESLIALGLLESARLDLALVVATLTSVVLLERGTYRSLEGPCHVEVVASIVSAAALALLGIVIAGPLLRSGGPTLAMLVADFPALVLGLAAERHIAGAIERRVMRPRLEPVVIYGAGTTGRLLAQKLLHEVPLGLRPIGFVDDAPELRWALVRVGEGEKGVKLPVLGAGEELHEVVARTSARAVFIAIPSMSSERIDEVVRRVEARREPVYFVPSSGHEPLASLSVRTMGGIPVLARRQPLRRAVYSAVKRLFDVSLSLVLLILAAPMILVGVVLVRLSSPGPAIFRHERVGFEGRRFTIYKLRTMRVDADAYAFHPDKASDERVTRVGRWLRKTSLDELPQLWNILTGDMSFVGPRPEMPFIVETYNDTQLQRLMVKPGLTGLWQVSPDRAFRIHDNIYYDLYYIERRSLALDLAILILTPLLMVAQHAAK